MAASRSRTRLANRADVSSFNRDGQTRLVKTIRRSHGNVAILLVLDCVSRDGKDEVGNKPPIIAQSELLVTNDVERVR